MYVSAGTIGRGEAGGAERHKKQPKDGTHFTHDTHKLQTPQPLAQVAGGGAAALDAVCVVCVVVACACPRLHGCQEEGAPGQEALAAAPAECRCVLVRRCVARGDVHGDATRGAPQVRLGLRKKGEQDGAPCSAWRDSSM